MRARSRWRTNGDSNDARIVRPGDASSSVLYHRMNRRDVKGMPLIGSTEEDDFAVERLVVGLVDDPHPACPDLLEDPKLAEIGSDHEWRLT